MNYLIRNRILFDGGEGGGPGTTEGMKKFLGKMSGIDLEGAAGAMKSGIPDLNAATSAIQQVPLGIITVVSEIGGGIAGTAFGEVKRLNTTVTIEEMTGGGMQGGGGAHETGGGDHSSSSHSGGEYDHSNDGNFQSAVQNLSSNDSHDYSDHSHIPQIQPSAGGASQSHGNQSHGHD